MVKMISKYKGYYFEAMQQQHHALPLGEGVLNKVLYREAPS